MHAQIDRWTIKIKYCKNQLKYNKIKYNKLKYDKNKIKYSPRA